ncbi:hypothetical protein N9933_02570 [bacterium]|nr:hypothetical protein [bacterium]
MPQETPQIDPFLLHRLTIEAKHRGLPVSELLTKAIQQYLGINPEMGITSNLDRLAGTWSKEEAKEFERNTEWFGKVAS